MRIQTVTEKLIREMSEKIVHEVNPCKVVLFGSHARGTAGPDSDLDFLVIENGPFDIQHSRRAEIDKLSNVLFDYFVPIDFLVFTPQEIEKWENVKNHVIFHALREGKTLYESH